MKSPISWFLFAVLVSIATTMELDFVARQKAQRDFCFPFASCCVKYTTCTRDRCTKWCSILKGRCDKIDLTLQRYAGYIPYCNNAKTPMMCYDFCISRKCGDLYCGESSCAKMLTPWSEFKNFIKKPVSMKWGETSSQYSPRR